MPTDSTYIYDNNNCNQLCNDTTYIERAAEGLQGIPRQNNNHYNNSLFIYLTFSLIVILLAISRKKLSLKKMITNKEEIKEEIKHTFIDIFLSISLFILSVTSGAIALIYLTTPYGVHPTLPIDEILKIGGAITLIFISQQIIIQTIGVVFFNHNQAKQFRKENFEFYTIPSLIFSPLLLLLIYQPWQAKPLILTALSIVAIIRLIYIIRNIKIFKHHWGTTCYIILYLCTVEIAPVFIMYKKML